jgi:hypothetical protein
VSHPEQEPHVLQTKSVPSKAQQPVVPATPAPKSVPLPLDADQLRKVSGGVTSAPHNSW